jgi:glycine/D-amino acid oxidase-like deaminating enzyme
MADPHVARSNFGAETAAARHRRAERLAFASGRRCRHADLVVDAPHPYPECCTWESGCAKPHIWPRLAEQCAAFEAVRLKGGWVGHYDMNRLDGNPIIDRCPAVPNFVLPARASPATGCSTPRRLAARRRS